MLFRSFQAVALTLLLLQHAGASEDSYRMPDYGDHAPPAARPPADVRALLAGSDDAPQRDAPLKLLLVAGVKDHGPGEHDYPAWQKVWARLLAKAPRTEVSTAWEFPLPEEADAADVMVFYQKGDWNDRRAALIDAFLARGGGLAIIHYAVNGNQAAPEFAKRIGLASETGKIGYRHGPLDIDFGPGAGHPIARNLNRVAWHDETYWRLSGDPRSINLLGTSIEEGESTPQFWTTQQGPGRVFVSVPGHYMWTFDDPAFRLLLMRGIAWAGGRNVDRFNDLVTLDARIGQ
ncbi:Trehalose utilization [Pirellulimonas nuda]|uniref:Trehalose utilization n=1 Tax=Pirellulimonas nuda TaxID=2528009 RepID=A0A518DE00_9BACT|nr:ThuA domain-containing protein [Pirellulimonas nuda]QDU89697.1 Trehalose utilization [Pirellulimonas nuda]